jgi:hypothetical protein
LGLIREFVIRRLTSRKRSLKESCLVYYHNQLSMLAKRFMMIPEALSYLGEFQRLLKFRRFNR